MSPLERAHFRVLLAAHRAQLREDAARGEDAAATVDLDQTRQGRLTRMDALQHQAMAQETGRRRDLQLQRIAAALGRLEAGEYGECLACGAPIPVKRLEVDPTATRCLACAEREEEQ